jgi:hypothetical protein
MLGTAARTLRTRKSLDRRLQALKNGCRRSFSADGRLAGSWQRQADTMSLNALENLLLLLLLLAAALSSRWTRLVILISIDLDGGRCESGGRPCASSSAVMPNDQMSALMPYPTWEWITSGAIQYGVPATSLRQQDADEPSPSAAAVAADADAWMVS